MSLLPTTQYVKFIKGTSAAWKNLSSKDSNTLYFISETNAKNGSLYLGEKLIANGALEDTITIDTITSTLLSLGVVNNSLLVYNTDNNQWELSPIETVIAEIIQVMSGATTNEKGKSGLVPAPESSEYHKFLRGDGTWQDPDESLSADLNELQSQLKTLIGEDSGKSVAQIINDSDIRTTWGSF